MKRSHCRALSRYVAAASVAAVTVCAANAEAVPNLRFQVDQQGDFVIVGNTLGHDCGSGNPAPVVGTVGACGSNVSDSSPDVFWRADEPASGSASADSSILASDSRSTAVLGLPGGATVTYARLYWAGMRAAAGADSSALLERPGSFSDPVSADVVHTISLAASLTQYESSADVTSLVQTWGVGPYRVSGVDSLELPNLNDSRAYTAWSIVVLYELAGDPLRQLTLFDGLDQANSGGGLTVDITGFLVPLAGIDAKLGVVAYGGDGQTSGDSMSFNGTDLSDGVGTTNNFFNASRTLLGSPVSVSGDLPQLTGGLRSMSALDLDVVDVTALVAPNDTTASVNIKAGGDNNILLGALCTAITTFKPNFNESIKTATDLNGGTLLAGDVLRYTIDVINTGNDPAIDVVLEDSLPAGVTYVPGSIQVTSDLVPSKTDVAGDDQGEFDSGSNLVRVRLGAGADDVNGGTMGIGETATVVFDVQVDADFVGVVSNRAQIVASGQSGAPETTYGSDDGNGGGSTDVVVDQCAGDGDCPLLTPRCFDPASPGQPNLCVECLTSADCSGTSPICDTGAHTCEPCAADSECDDKDALNPACQDTGSQIGACGECSENTDLLCSGSKPECLISLGICGCSDSNGDSECGASDSGIICNGPAGECVPGCSTAPQRNDCPADENCSKQDGTVGSCLGQPCQTSTDCTDPLLPVCDTVPNPHTCVACVVDTDCTAPLLCNPSRACVECTSDRLDNCSAADSGAACLANETCGCLTDDDCGASDSGRVCDGATSHCILGCRGTGGNGCEVPQVCTSTDNTIGSCVACTSNDDCTAPQVCDQTSDPPACVDCVTTADCDGALVCDETQQTCVECVKSSDCLAPQVCDTTAQQCVDCVVDPDCGSAMVCDKTTQTCIGCTDDADCTAGKLCDKTTQTCVECTDDSDCAAGKFCDGTTRTCVGCNSDADCAPAGSGLVCDTTEHSCVAGKTTRKDSVEGGGCACSLPASSRRPLPLLALLPLALLLGRRRHRVSRRKQTRSLPQ